MVTTASTSGAQQAQPERISWEDFQAEYLTREDAYKYEWLDGIVEKTERAMNYTQLFILRNLLIFFNKLVNSGKADGLLIPEPDVFFLKNHRRPDVAYFTDKQIDRTAKTRFPNSSSRSFPKTMSPIRCKPKCRITNALRCR